MKLYAVIMMMLVFSLPLVRAQVTEQPAVPQEQPIIPEDIAGALTGIGGGPAVSVIMDLVDTIVAVVFDFIDTCAALCVFDNLYGLGALLFDLLDTSVVLCVDIVDTVIAWILSFCYSNALWNCLLSCGTWFLPAVVSARGTYGATSYVT